MRWIALRVRSELRSSAGWASALAVAVALAVGAATIMVAGAARTATAPDRYADSRGEVHDVTIEQHSGAPVDLTALRSVDAAASATFVFGGLVAGTDAPAQGQHGMQGQPEIVHSILFAGSPFALGDELVEGRQPVGDGDLVVTRSFQEAVGAELGDRFIVLTISSALAAQVGFDVDEPDGPTVEATLVGIIDGPNDFQDGYPVAIMPSELLTRGDVGVAATVSIASLADGSTITDLRAELAALPGDVAFGVAPADWVPTEVRDAVAARATALWIVAAVVAVTTVVSLGQLATRQVRPSADTRRALVALGLTGRQVALERVALATPALMVGMVGAAAISYGLSVSFPLGFVSRLDPEPGRWWSPTVHLLVPLGICTAVGLWIVVAMLIAAWPSHRRRATPPVGGPRWSARLHPFAASVAVRLGIVRAGPDSASGLITLAGLGVVLAMLVGSLTFGANVTKLIELPDRYGAEFDAGIGTGGDELPDHVIDVLLGDPDITAIALYRTVLVRAGDEPLDVTGIDAVAGDLSTAVLDGRLPAASDEIALGRNAADDLGVAVGERLSLDGSTSVTPFTVTGLVVVPPIEGNDGVGDGALVTFEGLDRLDPDGAPTFVGFDLRGGPRPEILERLAERTAMGVGPIDQPISILNVARTTSAPLLLAAVLSLLGALSLTHFLLVSNRRRRRGTAILRALGADQRWISSMIHWQATLLILATLAAAIPSGLIAGTALYRWFVGRIGAVPEPEVPIAWLALTTVGALAIANGAAMLAAARAARSRPTSVLRGE